ncbi:MAG: sulfatase [Deltaproteobacteria bacterium]|nr:sulfatase [Deltaproteobacteria bacterium]
MPYRSVVMAALAGVGLAACTPPPPPRPDIVLFVVDALRADALPAWGYDRPSAPHLDDLAARGVVFERAFSHSSWTLPAFASLLTGRLPSEHGAVRDPADRLRFGRLDPDLPTLATLLYDAGWRTAAWVNNVFLAPEFALGRGFDTWDYEGAVGFQERSGTATVDAALAWLDAGSGPAFLLVHVMEPHLPYLASPVRGRFAGPPPAPFSLPFGDAEILDAIQGRTRVPDDAGRAWIRATYDEEVLDADRALGRLLDGLAARGRLEGTVVAFTADHGEEFWDHGGFEHGHTLYGELLHVPLVLAGPGLGAGRVAVPVQHADLFRTLLALAGVSPPPDVAGADLGASAIGPALASRPILSEDCLYGPARLAVTRGDERLILNLETRVANLFRLDEQGQSDALVPDGPELEADARPLLEAAFAVRGDLDLHAPPQRIAPLHDEAIERLRALGYLGPRTPLPSDPP